MNGQIMSTPGRKLIKSPEFPGVVFEITTRPEKKTLVIKASNNDYSLAAVELPPVVIMYAEAMRVERGW